MSQTKEGIKCSKCSSAKVSTVRFRKLNFMHTGNIKKSFGRDFGPLILGIECLDCGFKEQREIGPGEIVDA